MSDRIVGIDLGTSNTVVAIVDELDQIRILADAEGHTVHPSVVSFHPNGGVVVGVPGKERKVRDPTNTIYSAKRMIGQPFRSFAVTETARRVPFQIKEGPNEQAMVVTRSGEFAIPEISAIVLDHARKVASNAIKTEVARAVVTVPASFTDVQRASTATAGALAGLTVVRVLNEPTAAALAYGSTKRLNEIIAVYDFGGGTFDITILKLDDQVYTVLGTSGDAFLGGEDIDERIVERMVSGFLKEHRVDLRTDDVSMMRLRAVAEHTKIELSRRSRAVVKIEEVAYAANGSALDLTMQLTREELITSIGDLIDRTFVSCKEAMTLAGVAPDRIADVILVGGTTRIPIIRERVAQFFGMNARSDMNPDDAIAHGAALQASSIEQMLSRAPQRPMASMPVPVDDLIGDVLADPVRVEPEPTRSRIAEVKRPKRGSDIFTGKPATEPAKRSKEEPAKTTARAEAFFGDLFGDKPAKPGEAPTTAKATPAAQPPAQKPAQRSGPLAPLPAIPQKPAGPTTPASPQKPAPSASPQKPTAAKQRRVPVVPVRPKPGDEPAPRGQEPAQPETPRARTRESLDWAPPSGSAFSDDSDAVDVFAPEPAKPVGAQLADLSDDVELAADSGEANFDDLSIEVVPPPPTRGKTPARSAPPKLASSDDIAIEVDEPSMPAIRLDDLEDIETTPRGTPGRPSPATPARRERDPNEGSMPEIALDDFDEVESVPSPARGATARPRDPNEGSMPEIELDALDDVVEVDPTPDDEIAVEVVEPSMPEIRLDELDEVAAPKRAAAKPAPSRHEAPPDDDDEIAIEVSMPAIRVDDDDDDPRSTPTRHAPPELDWAPGVELANEIVVPPSMQPMPVADDIELAARSTPPSRVALELDFEVPPMRHDDVSEDADAPQRRHAPPELDWDPDPQQAPRAPAVRSEPSPPQPVQRMRASTRAPAAVIDVTPRGLGIGTVAGFCEELIRRNSQLPAAIRKTFVTSRDAQETVRIVICQGESRRIERNLVIGDLVLPNLPRRSRGETRIEVEFVLDASGILHVSARDAATGAEQRAKLDLKGGMAPEDMTAASKRLQELASRPID